MKEGTANPINQHMLLKPVFQTGAYDQERMLGFALFYNDPCFKLKTKCLPFSVPSVDFHLCRLRQAFRFSPTLTGLI